MSNSAVGAHNQIVDTIGNSNHKPELSSSQQTAARTIVTAIGALVDRTITKTRLQFITASSLITLLNNGLYGEYLIKTTQALSFFVANLSPPCL